MERHSRSKTEGADKMTSLGRGHEVDHRTGSGLDQNLGLLIILEISGEINHEMRMLNKKEQVR